MARLVLHITYDRTDHLWRVKAEGGGDFTAESFRRKAEAVRRAKEIAKQAKPSQVVIHLRNGKIEKEVTYGADPERHKG